MLCNNSAGMLSIPHAFPFGSSLITCAISSLVMLHLTSPSSPIYASLLLSSLYNSSTGSAHLSITSSFSTKLFPCLFLIVCRKLFPFGRISLIFYAVNGYAPYPTSQFPYTYPHSTCLWLHGITSGFPVLVSYTVLHHPSF